MYYLGVSKRPCNACTSFIAASNTHSDRTFYTRGSHGKWHFPWALPPNVNQEVLSAFRDSVGDCIADMLLETPPGDAFGTAYFADDEEEAEVLGVGRAGHVVGEREGM